MLLLDEAEAEEDRIVDQHEKLSTDERMDIIGQNGNDGLHYPPPGPDGYTPHPGPLDGTGEREPIDLYKDSEYIRLYGDKNEDN